MKLNLGCGHRRLPGYVNVDKQGDPDLKWDLEQFPWPWPDHSVAEVRAVHVLEHLGRETDVYLKIIQELYRVCANGTLVHITVPHPRHDNFLNDPTHVRPITPEQLKLFSRAWNDHCIKQSKANTPLALYLSVDFEITATEFALDPEWGRRREAGEITDQELATAARRYNNVVSEIKMTLRAIKNR